MVGKQKKFYAEYDIERAIEDITAYYRSGTLVSVIVSNSRSAKAVQTKLDTIK